ncbi:MAG: Immunity protein 74 [Labilithrix sp.]|nr:Immunity protein 74 [Labilithrix sp.]
MSKEMSGPGCGITMLGRAGLRYREGTQTVLVDGEMLTGPFDFVIYKTSIVEWEGSGVPIDDTKRNEIVANIDAAFQQNGLTVDVES